MKAFPRAVARPLTGNVCGHALTLEKRSLSCSAVADREQLLLSGNAYFSWNDSYVRERYFLAITFYHGDVSIIVTFIHHGYASTSQTRPMSEAHRIQRERCKILKHRNTSLTVHTTVVFTK